jgi:hypothetical protein
MSEREIEEALNENNFTSFTERRNIRHTKENDKIGVRCLRKKYKCIIIWCIATISITQLLYMIFDKLDEKFLNKISEKLYYLVKSNQSATI